MLIGENHEFVGYVIRGLLALIIIIIFALPLLPYFAR
jgi:hypothetical protein